MKKDKSEAAPAVKKARGKKAEAPVQSNSIEKESKVAATVKNARGKKAVAKQDSTDSESDEKETKLEKEEKSPAVKKGRGKKIAAKKESSESENAEDDDEEVEAKGSKAGKTLLKNNVTTDYTETDFNISQEFNLKVAMWNVAGIRALVKKNTDYFVQEDADVICMNVSCTMRDRKSIEKT
jgi:hypothetical protein